MTTALAVAQPQQMAAIQPQTMAELMTLAKYAADSGLYKVNSPAQALMLLMRGRDLGWSYSQALAGFHVIDGKACLTADAVVALCLTDSRVEYFRPIEQKTDTATWEIKLRNEDAPRRGTFTVEDAKKAKLIKEGNGSGWDKYPGRMCSARAKAFLGRDACPDRLMGLLTVEEAQDMADERKPPMRVVQAPQRETVTPDGEVIEGEEVRVADSLHAAIVAAETPAELAKVATRIKGATVTDDERAALRAAYSVRKAALAPKAEAVAETKPMREPGEE